MFVIVLFFYSSRFTITSCCGSLSVGSNTVTHFVSALAQKTLTHKSDNRTCAFLRFRVLKHKNKRLGSSG